MFSEDVPDEIKLEELQLFFLERSMFWHTGGHNTNVPLHAAGGRSWSSQEGRLQAYQCSLMRPTEEQTGNET
jgi:hypothetical protein